MSTRNSKRISRNPGSRKKEFDDLARSFTEFKILQHWQDQKTKTLKRFLIFLQQLLDYRKISRNKQKIQP